MSISCGEDFPRQQQRVRFVLGQHKEIGPAGIFGAIIIEAILQRAERAAISGDIVQILRSYKELKEVQG